MSAFKQRCVTLRRQGRTLGEIVRITGRPKTSVYIHIRNLPLTEKKWRSIRAAQGRRIRKFAVARRGKSARPFKAFANWDAELVLLVSHFLFDGEIRRKGCSYNNRNRVLLRRMETIVKRVYDFEPTRYFNASTGVHRISYHNVALGAYIKKKAAELVANISRMPVDLKREFLRAFFDDEGCMDYRPRKNMRRIRGYQKRMEVLRIVQILLREFTIPSRIQLPNEIVIVGKEGMILFEKEIGFSPGVRINGKRSNSIWKRSLEKRLILRKAIASYKPVGSNGVHRKRSKD